MCHHSACIQMSQSSLSRAINTGNYEDEKDLSSKTIKRKHLTEK